MIAKGKTMNQTEAELQISRARTRLLLDSPWFGALSMRLHVEAADCKTMQTDGTRLQFNPEYVQSITEQELTGVMAHEVMHCALLHPYRIGGRDLKTWNKACDYAVNQILAEHGFTLPGNVLLDSQYAGLSAETIYARLQQEQQDDGGEGDGEGDSDQPGQVVAPQAGEGDGEGDGEGSGPAEVEPMSATDWQIATEQASAISKKAGKLPGAADRATKAARESVTNWREILRRFIEQTVPSDYSWTQPNRRYVAAGLYLPGTVRENMPRLAVGVDTSGSINQADLSAFATELTQILHEARPEAIDVYYCDTQVTSTESFSPDDSEIVLHAQGGGGTEFQPVLDRIADDGSEPAALIYFTDLYGPAPAEPGYPVLWVTSEASTLEGPFGETVRIRAS
jgi:predicted metal-dependent peptidase